MEIGKIVDVLRATLDPNEQKNAELQLTEVHKIIGFAPVLLQVVMSDQVDMPIRQAGVIYLKNLVTHNWLEKEAANVTDEIPFDIHEQDKKPIRENIIEAIIHAPEPVRVQLCVCLSQMIKSDYPGKWPNAVEKMAMYISSDNHATWMGALFSIYHFVKVYEYKRCEERQVMEDTMVHVLPILYQRLMQFTADSSDPSLLLQKQILKIYYAYTQNYLPMSVLNKEFFTQWMEAIRQIADRDIPPETTDQVDEEDRPELPCWKLKKWACHILSRLFERYGSPGSVVKEYHAFSEWFLKTFSGGVLNVLLKLLDQYRQKLYVSPRVVLLALTYINTGINHAFTWKFIKPHMQNMIEDIIFPLMCHSDEDEDLWTSDPHEYIRIKYDCFEDFFSPTIAAQNVFHSSTAKRKDVLNKAMGFCNSLLTDPNCDPRKRDGAFHMVGSVADVLLKRKIYKDQAEMMLTAHIFPAFSSPHGYLRGRACWVIRNFSGMKFKSDENLMQAIEFLRNALCGDKDLPVRVEAAIAIQMFVSEDSKDRTRALSFIQPHVKQVIMELLNVIRETENDDLTGVMQSLVCNFREEVMPIALDMVTHLAQTFAQITETSDNDGSEEKTITALGIITAMQTILHVMQSHKEIIANLEGTVLSVVGIVLRNNIIDFYEEALALIESLTVSQVSPQMWEVFGMVYGMFQNDGGIDYFTEMMPALHNYITVDTDSFLANPTHLEVVFNMCKQVFNVGSSLGEPVECHAAKLLEVVLLQCPGKVDHVLGSFVELVLTRLTQKVKTSELRTMCLQVVISGLYYNSPLLFDTLSKLNIPNVPGSILAQFLQQWLHDADCFLGVHDRKVCVLGLCALMSMIGQRPQEINDIAPQILPACLILFQGLKRAYAFLAQEEESDSDEEEDDIEGVLESDEDDIDEDSQKYMEFLERAKTKTTKSALNGGDGLDDDDYDDDSDDEEEENDLEVFTTLLDEEDCPVDEYFTFKTILSNLPNQDTAWYQVLMSNMSPAQTTELDEIFKLADQRRAVNDSKKIEEGGGYNFTERDVPSTFNFGI